MGEYTCYNSAIHAACVVIQMYKGVEAGLSFSESLFAAGTEDGECDAPLLATLLRAEGLSCSVYEVLPTDVEAIALDGLADGRVTLLQIRQQRGTGGLRWALTHCLHQGHYDYAVCVGADERPVFSVQTADDATGQVVQMQYRAWPIRKVMANIVQDNRR